MPLQFFWMAKAWILDTETKGTGARMVPLEDVVSNPEPKAPPLAPRRRPGPRSDGPKRAPRPGEKHSTSLPAGHVRKKSTGEIGRVTAVDAKAGTATVTWLRQARTSTVPLSSITRK